MSNASETRVECLCGAVRLVLQSVGANVGACHCEMCLKWAGGPFLAVDCGTEVTIEGEEHLGVFDSSQWAERGFCSRCGSSLFYRLKHNQQYMVAAGLLGDREGLTFASQVFVDKKPGYYAFANETEDMTGAEVFAKFAPK